MKLHPVLRWLLWPLSLLYGVVARFRVWCYRAGVFRSRSLDQVVISIGNLTVGGTGKTPAVIWMAERLVAEGKSAAILSSGYRAAQGPNGTLSDEVQLMRHRLGNRVPVAVGRDRYAAAAANLRKDPIDCFVLDDGFQHLRLKRDLDIVLVDAANPFGNGSLLPAGPLREPISAVSRAHAIVITRDSRAPAIESILRRHSTAPIFYAQTELRSVLEWSCSGAVGRSADPKGHRYLLFCAIGNPLAFRDDLSRWGFMVVASKFFRDHHRFSQAEADEIQRLAVATDATALVCSEKDTFNLDDVKFASLPVHFCQIDLRISDEKKLWCLVQDTLRRHSAEKRA